MKLYVQVNKDNRANYRGPLIGEVLPYYSRHGVIAFLSEKWVRHEEDGVEPAQPGMVGVIQGDEQNVLYTIDVNGEAHALPVRVVPLENWVEAA